MDKLKQLLEQLQIKNPDKKTDFMKKYMEEILSWNEKVNLTAITDRKEFIHKHFEDSLLVCSSPEFAEAVNIIDVGTGGGFPGVPLAICFPEKNFVLMDSLAKRVNIVEILCREIGIKNVTTLHGRAEELARKEEYRENFDMCVSRAVANMSTLTEYCLPFVRTGGYFVAYKGPDCKSEISDASNAIRVLGGKVLRTDVVPAPSGDFSHSLIFVEKCRPVPAVYPRKPGTPARKPL